jgi:hypothetical protein
MLQHFCQWIYNSVLGTSIRESIWVFPLIETIHVLGITLLVGTVALLDLRLLVMFVSGFLLFSSEAADSYGNPAFRIKLVLLALAGLNPLIFHLTIFRSVASWNHQVVTPVRARLAGMFSLTLWGGIICAGRAIAYFQK